MRVIAYTKYDRAAASTRQRILQYAPYLQANGIDLEYRPLLPDSYVASLATGEPVSKAAIAANYAERLRDILRPRPRADLVWIYSELFPYLPAAIERLVFRSGVPVIYDWDDAFFTTYQQHRSGLARLLGTKFEQVLPRAAAMTCGNAYLRDYAARFCDRAEVFPTVVDTDQYRPARGAEERPLTIGWIGSPSSWSNVQPVLPLIAQFCVDHGARFRVVGAGTAARADCFEGLDLIDWSEDREIAEVQGFDIGIMPLNDGPFERGKSGYKLIQYMACEVPTIASPVGANRQIVDDGETGFLAKDPAGWRRALAALAADSALRSRIGANGRAKVEQYYSLRSQAPRLVELFRSVAQA
jgi:glycosyltransferase involved in cell wall biosynthesis